MRIHIQSLPEDPRFAITPALWAEAAARAPDVSAGHAVTFGETAGQFQAAMQDAEALVAQTGAVRALFPAAAPRLRLIYCTSAGLDGLAPFDWLPPDAQLLNNRGTPCGEGRRVWDHGASDAGERHARVRDGAAGRAVDAAARGRAGRAARGRGGARVAGRRSRRSGGALRHARHRRPHPRRATPGLRARRDAERTGRRAAGCGVPGAGSAPDGCDAWPAGPPPDCAAAAPARAW